MAKTRSNIENLLSMLPHEQQDEIMRGIRAMIVATVTFRMRDKVKLYRMEHGLTQADFARCANLDRGFVQRLEAGVVVDPLLSNVLKLATMMGCTIDELLDDHTREELLAKPTISKPRKAREGGVRNGTEK